MVFHHHRLMFQGLLHQDAQALEINRLGQIIVSPQPHGRDRIFHGAEGGHQDEQGVAVALADLREQFQAARAGHFDVGNHQVV